MLKVLLLRLLILGILRVISFKLLISRVFMPGQFVLVIITQKLVFILKILELEILVLLILEVVEPKMFAVV